MLFKQFKVLFVKLYYNCKKLVRNCNLSGVTCRNSTRRKEKIQQSSNREGASPKNRERIEDLHDGVSLLQTRIKEQAD